MLNTDLSALEDRILVEEDAPQEVTKGGIILPDASQERPSRGTVIAVGPGKFADRAKSEELAATLRTQHADALMSGQAFADAMEYLCVMPVSVGDKVYFTRYGGQTLNIPGNAKLQVLRPEHIIALCPPEAD